MTDTYLRSLGFAPTDQERSERRMPFSLAWRYQQEHLAQDGAALYIEHPFGIDGCRLSHELAPLRQQDVFTTVPLHDGPGLEAAIKDFYRAHGGQGRLAAPPAEPTFRPFRRGR